MKTKYLLCELSNEFDSFVAVIELTQEYQKVLLERMNLAASLESKNLAWIQYFDYSINVYETSDEVESWIDENADIKTFELDNMVFCDKEPDCVGWKRVRMGTSYIKLDKSSMFWITSLKHDNRYLETSLIYRKNLTSEGK